MPPDRQWYFKYQLENKRFIELDDKYYYLLQNWKKLLVKEVATEREMMEKDKVIIALQDRIKKLTTLNKCG